MLTTVKIKNFKSIRDLEFSARKVNVFIGEPNTGKSNLIEALAMFSPGTLATSEVSKEILRYKATADLFFDQKVANQVSVSAFGAYGYGGHITLSFGSGGFEGAFFWQPSARDKHSKGSFKMGHAGISEGIASIPVVPIRYYHFKPLTAFPNGQPGTLSAPFGDNLVAVLYTDEAFRNRATDLIRSTGFRLQLKPADNELLITKEIKEVLISYPWTGVSETLQRAVFLTAVPRNE